MQTKTSKYRQTRAANDYHKAQAVYVTAKRKLDEAVASGDLDAQLAARDRAADAEYEWEQARAEMSDAR